MKDHDDALWLLTGIRPIEVNEVAIAELQALAPQRQHWALAGPMCRIVCTCGFFAHLGVGKCFSS